MLGNAIAPIALAFAVLDLTGSATDLGLVLAARTSRVVFLLFGGVLADRLPRHLVLVASNIVSGVPRRWWRSCSSPVTLTSAARRARGGQRRRPPRSLPGPPAMPPQTVPAADLQPANALLPPGHQRRPHRRRVAGRLVVATVGPGWALAIDAGDLRRRAPCCCGDPAVPAAADAAENVLADLREGWTEFSAGPGSGSSCSSSASSTPSQAAGVHPRPGHRRRDHRPGGLGLRPRRPDRRHGRRRRHALRLAPAAAARRHAAMLLVVPLLLRAGLGAAPAAAVGAGLRRRRRPSSCSASPGTCPCSSTSRRTC